MSIVRSYNGCGPTIYNCYAASIMFAEERTDTRETFHSKFDYCEIIQNEMPVAGSSDTVKVIYTRLGRLITISVYCVTRDSILMEGDVNCVIALADNNLHNIANALVKLNIMTTTHNVMVATNNDLIESRPAIVDQDCITISASAGEEVPNFSISFNHS